MFITGNYYRPNVAKAKSQPDFLPEMKSGRHIIHDNCDKCLGVMNVYMAILSKRKYGNKIYCENCYDKLTKEEREHKGKNTIQRGGKIIN